MIGLNKIGLNQVQLNQLYLNTLCTGQKSSGGDGFPRLPGDVTRWSFKGLTNEMMSKNPRLEDADHKGRFLTFKNFAWSGMSGVGGYNQNFNQWGYGNLSTITQTHTSDKMIVNIPALPPNITTATENIYSNVGSVGAIGDVYDLYIRVTGLKSNVRFIVGGGIKNEIAIDTTQDGIYHINLSVKESWQQNRIYFWFYLGSEPTEVTIEHLPLYPSFIIGDGVDDYAVTEKNFDFQDTYTVYTAFIPFKSSTDYPVLCGKDYKKDFYINFRGDNLSNINFYSVDKYLFSGLLNGFNLFACKRTANKIVIKNLITGASKESDIDSLIENPGLYYLWKSAVIAQYSKAAIAGQVICNGHFTTDEEDTKVLNWYKKEYPWLFFDQAWTVVGKSNEDTDRATIANITGNGNNLVLSNFGFAGNSGYGEWPAIVLNSGLSTNQPYGTLYFTESDYASSVTEYLGSFNFKFRVRELPDGGNFTIRGYREDSPTENAVITKIYNANGVYELSYDDNNVPIRLVFYNGKSSSNRSSFYVDIIPDHEGYLVTDGVDDKVYSPAFTLGKKFTVVGEWIFIKTEQVYTLAGIMKSSSFILYNYNAGTNAYILSLHGTLINREYAVKAVQSPNTVYLSNWNERKLNTEQNGKDEGKPLAIGWNTNNFTRLAFKNIAIYGKELSKEDTIKAYIYLQTLKAK